MQSAAVIAPLPSLSTPRLVHLPILVGGPLRPRWIHGLSLGPRCALPPHPPSGDRNARFWGATLPLPSDWDQRGREKGILTVRTSSVNDSMDGSSAREAAAAASDGSLVQTLMLGSLFGLWYLFNIYFNIYNKQVLKVFHYPLTITLFRFAIGTFIVLFMWTTNFYKRPRISASELAVILPLAIVHTMGNLFTNMSLGKFSVSFTHTIKAMGSFFSVLFSSLFLRELPTVWVVISLVPIVGGIALASLTEASFNWAGFWSAMASNLTFQSGNVLSKKVMVKKEESMDNINRFAIITIMSFFLLAPATLFVEGIKFTPTYLQSAGLNLKQTYSRAILAGLCFHAYQQVSYMILARVSPVTHSVGNCVKRVVVIVTSVLYSFSGLQFLPSTHSELACLLEELYCIQG